MTTPVFPFAGLVIAPEAIEADGARIAELARRAADAGAAPVVVATPPGVETGSETRVVRTRHQASTIAAIRLGMAQLTNTVARAVLLIPFGARDTSLVTLLAVIDGAKRSENVIVALEGVALGESPLLVPRDAWLELVTVGEGGMEAVAARRGVTRVRGQSS